MKPFSTPSIAKQMAGFVRLRSGNVALFLVACFIYYAGKAPFIGQWDSFDYLKQTVTHRLSDLAFGRPVFIGYNVVLWEISKHLFRLAPSQVEGVVMTGIILAGAVGVLVFRKLARELLPSPASEAATLALMLSPMYVVYAGSVMTEVPMLTVAMAAAVVLWVSAGRHSTAGPLAGGLLIGLATGIREQAITLAGACLWILWVRLPDLSSRLRAWVLFGVSTGVAVALPIVALYWHDPAGFWGRTQTWTNAIPMGQVHFLKNLEASSLFALAVCPGAWLALVGAGFVRGYRALCRGRRRGRKIESQLPAVNATCERTSRIVHPVWGILSGLILPMAVLWRDADVQMHPRYLLILLPAALLASASLYSRVFDSLRGAVGWAVLQILVFGAAVIVLEPLRQIQYEKKEFAELVKAKVPDDALLIPGGLSPVLDYYRGIGIRPNWRILWSGWGWNPATAGAAIRESWARGEPVYLCDAPYGWLMFEDERLDLHFILQDCRREVLAPGITRYYPRHQGRM
jgi:hypothetical protein